MAMSAYIVYEMQVTGDSMDLILDRWEFLKEKEKAAWEKVVEHLRESFAAFEVARRDRD